MTTKWLFGKITFLRWGWGRRRNVNAFLDGVAAEVWLRFCLPIFERMYICICHWPDQNVITALMRSKVNKADDPMWFTMRFSRSKNLFFPNNLEPKYIENTFYVICYMLRILPISGLYIVGVGHYLDTNIEIIIF